jgi:hypothetical protein
MVHSGICTFHDLHTTHAFVIMLMVAIFFLENQENKLQISVCLSLNGAGDVDIL